MYNKAFLRLLYINILNIIGSHHQVVTCNMSSDQIFCLCTLGKSEELHKAPLQFHPMEKFMGGGRIRPGQGGQKRRDKADPNL